MADLLDATLWGLELLLDDPYELAYVPLQGAPWISSTIGIIVSNLFRPLIQDFEHEMGSLLHSLPATSL